MMVVALVLAGSLGQLPPELTDKLSLALRLELRREAVVGKAASAERLLVLRARRPLAAAAIAELEARGASFERWQGRVLSTGRFYGVRVDRSRLAELLASPWVERLLPPAPHKTLPWTLPGPLGGVHALTRAAETWPRRDLLGRRHTGAGVVIADMDSGIDVFHPLFFRGDGGLFAWLDVDRNGAFTPGVDAVDLDRNGRVSPDELLHTLGGRIFWYATVESEPTGTFEAGRHWLYADSNGNGARDYGAAAGFHEGTPAFGEPLFVVDDVDADGILDLGEGLVRLSSSKVRAVIRTFSGDVRERGVDLILTPAHTQVSHGTGAGGILVGGVYGLTQVQGVAPDADLIMIDQYPAPGDPTDPRLTDVAQVALARELGAQILVHEYGTHIFTFGDGSDPWEEHLDTLSAGGMVQVTATHNFAAPGGKALLTLAAGETRALAWEILPAAEVGFAPTVVYFTLRWRGGLAADLEVRLLGPGGIDLPLSELSQSGDTYASTEVELSPRGTAMLGSQLFRWDGGGYPPLLSGAWSVQLHNLSGAAREVHLSIGDETGYAYGVELLDAQSSLSTMAFPATADSAISVGASAGNVPEIGELVGALKVYSGRGPRIDGPLGIEVVAPEDHYTAVPARDAAHGDFQRFAGTSGALPQVAGAVALLLQAEPELTPAEVLARLTTASAADEQTGATPNAEWGHGKLDTQRLVFGEVGPNTRPTARLFGPAEVRAGEEVQLDGGASRDAEEGIGELWFRWDLDYDGVWERQGRGDARPTVVFAHPGATFVKLEVEDSAGLAAQALLRLTVVAAPAAGGCGCDAASGGLSLVAGACGWLCRPRRGMRRRESR